MPTNALTLLRVPPRLLCSQADNQAAGGIPTSTFTMTIAAGVIQGTFAPISGSVAAMSGTSTSGGTTGATLTGAYVLTPSSTCNTASGSWTASRSK